MFLASRIAYHEALQHPEWSLRGTGDDNLINGRVVRGPLAAPHADQVAVVYQFAGRDGRQYALRCFLPGYAEEFNLPPRYEQINGFFRDPQRGLACHTAEARYWARGLTVRLARDASARCPLVALDWIEGKTLVQYLDQMLANPLLSLARKQELIDDLLRQLRHILERLDAAGAAIGDLAGSNIIVDSDGRLVIVDFDTAFIPEFRGLGGLVGGQWGYRHPRLDAERASGALHFNAFSDRFAGQVMLTALLALRAEPKLWRLRTSAHAILFSNDDLSQPDRSPVFRELLALPDHQVQRAALLLKIACGQPLAELEPPHSLPLRLAAPPSRRPVFTAALHGDQLQLDLRSLAGSLSRLPAIVVAWGADGFPASPELDPEHTQIVRVGAHETGWPLPHRFPGATCLYVRLFAAAEDGYPIWLKPTDDPIEGGEAVALPECVVTYRLLHRAGRPINVLAAETDNGTALPRLLVVRKQGSPPGGPLGNPLVGELGDGDYDREDLLIHVAERQFPPDTYLGVFLADDADRARVTLRPAAGANGLRVN